MASFNPIQQWAIVTERNKSSETEIHNSMDDWSRHDNNGTNDTTTMSKWRRCAINCLKNETTLNRFLFIFVTLFFFLLFLSHSHTLLLFRSFGDLQSETFELRIGENIQLHFSIFEQKKTKEKKNYLFRLNLFIYENKEKRRKRNSRAIFIALHFRYATITQWTALQFLSVQFDSSSKSIGGARREREENNRNADDYYHQIETSSMKGEETKTKWNCSGAQREATRENRLNWIEIMNRNVTFLCRLWLLLSLCCYLTPSPLSRCYFIYTSFLSPFHFYSVRLKCSRQQYSEQNVVARMTMFSRVVHIFFL